MFNVSDITRNEFMLTGGLSGNGYDWWWHSFTAKSTKTGEERPFFVEFFICNPALGGKEPVFGQLPENKEKGVKPSYLMIKAGCWGKEHAQLHRFFGIEEVDIKGTAPFSISAGECYASENRLFGNINVSEEEKEAHPEWMSDAGKIQFNLTIEKEVAFNVGYGAGKPLRLAEAFEMYWHAEGMKSLFYGSVIFNGEEFEVIPESSYGYADKNWGKDFTSPWLWLSSNHMVSRKTGKELTNSVFDIGGGRPKVYFMPLERKLLGAFYYEGKEYEYNFSKPWTGAKTRFKFEEKEDEVVWKVILNNSESVMKVEVHCKKEDMLFINYEAPNGKKLHNKLFNGGNGTGRVWLYKIEDGLQKLVDDIDIYNVGCEYGEYDEE
ncbi:MAG: hypothetical protein K6B75_00200 [Lachnospiraceae bacterium]|nr:hypothetical protein [Lachnospiraceae bacterium]